MSAITVVADPQADNETTITLKTDEWYALVDGINMLRAGYTDNGAWIPGAARFKRVCDRVSAILMGFNN